MNTVNEMELKMDELADVTGGDGLRDFPHYDTIKRFYKERGMGDAFTLCRTYGLSVEESYAILRMIKDEVDMESGNCF